MLGAILISRNETNVTGALTKDGVPAAPRARGRELVRRARAAAAAAAAPRAMVHDVQLAFAHSTQTVFYIMAGVMAVDVPRRGALAAARARGDRRRGGAGDGARLDRTRRGSGGGVKLTRSRSVLAQLSRLVIWRTVERSSTGHRSQV